MELTTNQGMLSQLVHCVRSIISSDLDYLDCLGQQLGLQQHLDSERLSTGNFWGSRSWLMAVGIIRAPVSAASTCEREESTMEISTPDPKISEASIKLEATAILDVLGTSLDKALGIFSQIKDSRELAVSNWECLCCRLSG